MRANLFSELLNLLDILIPKILFRKTTIGFKQTPGKIGRSIAHETFDLIEHSAHLLWSEARMIEEGNKGMSSLLKVDIVLPKSIVCIDQEMITHILSFFALFIIHHMFHSS